MSAPYIGTPVIRLGLDLAAFLRSPVLSQEQRMHLLGDIFDFAEGRLVVACKRIGIPIDDLTDTERTLTIYWSVKEAPEANAGDLQACELMDACADAVKRQRLDQYGRDRIVLAFNGLDDDLKGIALKYMATQADRRKGKPAADPADSTRNDRLRKYYAGLVEERGEHGATSAAAAEFGLSTRQTRRILAG